METPRVRSASACLLVLLKAKALGLGVPGAQAGARGEVSACMVRKQSGQQATTAASDMHPCTASSPALGQQHSEHTGTSAACRAPPHQTRVQCAVHGPVGSVKASRQQNSSIAPPPPPPPPPPHTRACEPVQLKAAAHAPSTSSHRITSCQPQQHPAKPHVHGPDEPVPALSTSSHQPLTHLSMNLMNLSHSKLLRMLYLASMI
jgi:hypothetical protein